MVLSLARFHFFTKILLNVGIFLILNELYVPHCSIFAPYYLFLGLTHLSMKKLFTILCFMPLLLWGQPCKEVVGYYAGWQWYDRNKVMNPQSVPYNKYTILTYAFFSATSRWDIKNLRPLGR